MNHQYDAKQHGYHIDKGDHEAHVIGSVALLVEFHQYVTGAGAKED